VSDIETAGEEGNHRGISQNRKRRRWLFGTSVGVETQQQTRDFGAREVPEALYPGWYSGTSTNEKQRGGCSGSQSRGSAYRHEEEGAALMAVALAMELVHTQVMRCTAMPHAAFAFRVQDGLYTGLWLA
jgi:hypothetical protein